MAFVISCQTGRRFSVAVASHDRAEIVTAQRRLVSLSAEGDGQPWPCFLGWMVILTGAVRAITFPLAASARRVIR